MPLQRVGTPEDMAAAVLYFAGRGGAWVTGVILPVDGGALVGSARRPEETSVHAEPPQSKL